MRDSSKKKAHASVNSMSEGATDAYRKGRSGMIEQLGHLNAKVAKEGLEPCDGKLSCPVLRGLGVSNDPRLPGLLLKMPICNDNARIRSN